MNEAAILNCPVKVNDKVQRGDILFEVETDKATLEVESPSDGFVKHILVQEGQTISVGEVIMLLGDEDENVPRPETEKKKVTAKQPQPHGPSEEISDKELLQALSEEPQTQPQYKLGQTVPMTRLQKITAQKMLLSKQQIPCFYLTAVADVTKLVEHREKFNQHNKTKVSYNDFIIRAAAAGLEKFPLMTARLDRDEIILADSIDIGLAVSVQDGLVTAILKNVNKKTVLQIAREAQSLIEKAHSGKLGLDDLHGGCMTVSNLGAYGVESFIPIVVPGQCSILGIGKIIDTLLPDNGSFNIRKLMSMTLSVDHKLANGAYAAQFLDFIRKLLEDPANFE